MNLNVYFIKSIAAVLVIFVVFYFIKQIVVFSPPSVSSTETSENQDFPNSNTKTIGTSQVIPSEVYTTLDYITKYHKAPEGFIGGRTFFNREKKLPLKDGSGQMLKYQEWDIHPKLPHKNRGAERLITDSYSNAYYTNDHYKTFIKIKP